MKTSLRKADWNTSAFFIFITCFIWHLILPTFSFGQVKQHHTTVTNGIIKGYVLDAENKKPVDFARIVLLDPSKTTYTDTFGYFELQHLPFGLYTLQIYRIGYRSGEFEITVTPNDSNTVTIELLPRPISSETVIIRAEKDEEEQGVTGTAIYKMTGEKLRQSLGLSIAKTLDGEPGLSQRSMGPAPARPVLRGLGSHRLLMLEDGSRTGDLSATSNDHAVALDPLNADQIEVYRGPEALQFGANTIAGVINVWNRNIPTSLPSTWNLTGTLQGETVNTGLAGGFHANIPYNNNMAFTVSGSGRTAGNTQTPVGTLKNTGLKNYRASAGGSYITPTGFIGGSVSVFNIAYGIPGGFIGAHPNGVDIQSERTQAEIRFSYQPKQLDWLHHIDGNYNYTQYYHREYESSGVLGVLFGVLTYSGNLKAHTEETVLGKSTFGLWGEFRDYANGGFVFTPNTYETDVAAYWYNEKTWDNLRFESTIRFDYKSINPLEERFSRTVGFIRDRTFATWSGALEAEYDFNEWFSSGIRLMRTFRAPGLEELYSEGPHLAAYSYEVGSADNEAEIGIGTEGFFSIKTSHIHGSLSVYRNDIRNYLFPRDIDSLNIAKLLPIYRFTGQDALFYGTEAHIEADLTSKWSSSFTFSYTHATLTETGNAVPFIPPLQGKIQLNYRSGAFNWRVHTRASATQNRTGEFEEPTDGFILIGGGGEYLQTISGNLHIISVQLENILNTEYRNHLSRVKSVMPEPGFTVSIVYRIYI